MGNPKRINLAYLSGPVDAVDVYTRWKAGQHTQLFGTSYLMQFFDLCAEIDCQAFVITTLPGSFKRHIFDNVIIENRPPPTVNGLRYHLSMIWWMLALAKPMFRFKPTAFVATANQNYWFVLSFLKFMGTEIIPSAHCVMWRPFRPIPLHWRPLLWLDGVFLRLFVRRGMAVSKVAADQLKSMAKSKSLEVFVITPTYDLGHFDGIGPADHNSQPFFVMFSGRIEANKGVYDLLDIAARLQGDRPGDFHFDFCGEGSDLDQVRELGRSLKNVAVHGFCDKQRLTEIMSRCHIVVVPTRSDFEEGLPKTCAEAVLAGRPFVASAVCPLLYTLRAAAVEVPPDDAMAYQQAITILADDAELYREKVAACHGMQAQFYDANRSYKALLRRHLVDAQILRSSDGDALVTHQG